MIEYLDGKKLAQEKRKALRAEISFSLATPKLAVIQVGNDKASTTYVRNKSKACQEVGIEFEDIKFPENVSFEEVFNKIDELNLDPEVHGILIQQPLPRHLQGIEQYVAIEKDVDGFTEENLGKLVYKKQRFMPCTTKGIIDLLDEYRISVKGKHIVILGRSVIVGKSTALALLNRDATVTICHSKTENLEEITQKADILIVAIGQPKFITADYIGDKTQVVIDVGINRLDDGTLIGDCDYWDIIDRWKFLEDAFGDETKRFITPVPGGVGPLTVSSLLDNVFRAYID